MITAPVIDVCATCTVTTLRAAIAQARPGSILRIKDRQGGNVVVRVPLTIAGAGGEIVATGSAQTGIDVRADGVTVRDLTLRGFGSHDDSGHSAAIVLRAANSRLERLSFDGNAFAVSAVAASRSTISDSRFLSQSSTGDPIRFWRSSDMKLTNSTVSGGRDVFISWSPRVTIEHTTFTHLRYGLHDMYSPNMIVSHSTFSACEIGANFMYAQDVDVSNNRFERNTGPTGYGIGVEDTGGGRFSGNVIAANHVGMHVVDSPPDPSTPIHIDGNLFAANGSGLVVQSDARSTFVNANAFVNNIEQVEVSGGASASGIAWSVAGAGNYWSDYAGFDRLGRGIGEIPYRPRSTFETIVDQWPDLQIFRYSAAAAALDFATRALAIQPLPKLTDDYPLMTPPSNAAAAGGLDAPRNRMSFPAALMFAALGALPLTLSLGIGRIGSRRRIARTARPQSGIAVEMNHVRKLYAGGRGVDDVSLRITRGESVALWGPNGAGKTTLIRCLLDQTDARGRASIGYAPQHLPDFEMRVRDVIDMMASIRGADPAHTASTFEALELDMHDERFIAELSGGTRQRLCVALALLGDPPIVVLDEPTAGLDRVSRKHLIGVLLRLRAAGKTLLFTSHNPEDVHALADRVVILENGRIADDVVVESFARIAS